VGSSGDRQQGITAVREAQNDPFLESVPGSQFAGYLSILLVSAARRRQAVAFFR
jgi:hypothetical protein